MYSTPDDLNRCEIILQNILSDKGISLDTNSINKIAQRVLALTYAKGGNYTDESLEAYIKIFLRDNPV
jgi:hypothetical protein